jgi:hypothetical protein
VAIVALAAKHRLSILSSYRDTTRAGGLISYLADHAAHFRRTAIFVDKILKGAKPAELPVEQPTKFELVVNLKTAKALDLEVPPTLLARADDFIIRATDLGWHLGVYGVPIAHLDGPVLQIDDWISDDRIDQLYIIIFETST